LIWHSVGNNKYRSFKTVPRFFFFLAKTFTFELN